LKLVSPPPNENLLPTPLALVTKTIT